MKHGIRIHRRRLRRIALGLAVAAIAVPSAQAAQITAGVAHHASKISSIEQRTLPDARARHGVDTAASAQPSDVSTHRVGDPWGPATDDEPVRPDDPATAVDWAAFGIGAGLGVAATALLLAALLGFARRHGHPTTA
jgi:hypothetical protein